MEKSWSYNATFDGISCSIGSLINAPSELQEIWVSGILERIRRLQTQAVGTTKEQGDIGKQDSNLRKKLKQERDTTSKSCVKRLTLIRDPLCIKVDDG